MSRRQSHPDCFRSHFRSLVLPAACVIRSVSSTPAALTLDRLEVAVAGEEAAARALVLSGALLTSLGACHGDLDRPDLRWIRCQDCSPSGSKYSLFLVRWLAIPMAALAAFLVLVPTPAWIRVPKWCLGQDLGVCLRIDAQVDSPFVEDGLLRLSRLALSHSLPILRPHQQHSLTGLEWLGPDPQDSHRRLLGSTEDSRSPTWTCDCDSDFLRRLPDASFVFQRRRVEKRLAAN